MLLLFSFPFIFGRAQLVVVSFQRYIREFQVAQERAKAAQRDAELAEQRRIDSYNASRAGRAEAAAKAKAEDDAIKEARCVRRPCTCIAALCWRVCFALHKTTMADALPILAPLV